MASSGRSHLITVLLGVLLLGSVAVCHATVEFIGVLNGQRVFLIWGNECSALDPPTDNVARVELTYTGTPQPGVFSNIVLFPPFDSFDTDGESYLHVFASTPMPMPCDTCYESFVQFDTVLPLEEPGETSPFDFAEFNDQEGFCSGSAIRSDRINVPATNVWGQILLALAIGGIALTVLVPGIVPSRQRL
jgi:hypothetical protein